MELSYASVTTLPKLDPPVKEITAIRLIDGDINTCMQLLSANMYMFSQPLGEYVPAPKHVCFRRGLVVKKCVPSNITRSFSVAITGRLDCFNRGIKLLMKLDKTQLKCGTGWYHRCKMTDAKSGEGGLTTCVAECRCEGKECSSLDVHIEDYKDEWNWKICEINLT